MECVALPSPHISRWGRSLCNHTKSRLLVVVYTVSLAFTARQLLQDTRKYQQLLYFSPDLCGLAETLGFSLLYCESGQRWLVNVFNLYCWIYQLKHGVGYKQSSCKKVASFTITYFRAAEDGRWQCDERFSYSWSNCDGNLFGLKNEIVDPTVTSAYWLNRIGVLIWWGAGSSFYSYFVYVGTLLACEYWTVAKDNTCNIV